jgi:release factor glutamine methyltransferase
MQVLTLPGVFAPRSDSWLLADQLAERAGPGVRVLDLCTGSGVAGVSAARRGADVTVVDVSRRALATASFNAVRHGRRVAARRGHLFRAVAGHRFDVISANPPYVPSTSADLPTRGPSRAWAAGLDGRVVLDEICDRAADHLVPGGELLLVHSSVIGEDDTLRRLRDHGFATAQVIERRSGPLGPLMLEQQRLGRIPADQQDEDVIVVSARTPTA